jgi:molecular chaperone DnaK
MKKEAELNADSDKAARERVDKLNQADSLIFQTEKQLKEFGEKIPAEKKQPIEEALNKLKTAHAAEDIPGIDSYMAELNSVFSAASEEMYKAAQEAQANGTSGGSQANTSSTADAEVTDVDFEEVKDEKK